MEQTHRAAEDANKNIEKRRAVKAEEHLVPNRNGSLQEAPDRGALPARATKKH